jgi:hypothetical protein
MNLNTPKRRIPTNYNTRETILVEIKDNFRKPAERKNRSVYKDTWGKRRGAFLPSRSFNQLWKERQQK